MNMLLVLAYCCSFVVLLVPTGHGQDLLGSDAGPGAGRAARNTHGIHAQYTRRGVGSPFDFPLT